MRLLLDTHIFIWWAGEPARLPPTFLSHLRNPENTLVLSVASVWEMQIKAGLGKLELRQSLSELIESQRRVNGLELLTITLEHVLALEGLPRHHGDPFDRLLVAQANAEAMPLMSTDRVFVNYPVELLG